MNQHVWVILLCLTLAGCNTVSDYYQTRKSAIADQLFERGWLPGMIPKSSYRIQTHNDLDSNISHGEFYFDPKEAVSFINLLQPYKKTNTPFVDFDKEVQERMKSGYVPYTYTDSFSRWVFFIRQDTGHIHYISWMLEREARNFTHNEAN